MKNKDSLAPDDNNSGDTNADNDTVPQAIIGVLPIGASFGSGMAGTTTAGNQGAYPGGAALLPIATLGGGGDTEDQQISQELETALAEAPTLASHATSDLQFSVSNGVIRLAGKVPTDHEHQTILSLARKITGIAGVEDVLIVG